MKREVISKNSFTNKKNIDINDESSFPNLCPLENKINSSENENKYISAIKKNKAVLNKNKNTQKRGWVTLTKESQNVVERNDSSKVEKYNQAHATKIMQQLVNRWRREKEEYISVYGIEDYINVYGTSDIFTDDEEGEFDDGDYLQDEVYDNEDYYY
jgi:hypothetical protein